MPDFHSVCEQHMAELYAFFAYRLGSRIEAEDLTQETLERAFRAWSRYDSSRAAPRTWLLAIARNLLIDHYRASAGRSALSLEEDSEIAADHVEPDLGLDPDLAAALRRLSQREREIIALRFGADLTGPEIATMTGLTLANVQQILSRSLRRLRTYIDGPLSSSPADESLGPP